MWPIFVYRLMKKLGHLNTLTVANIVVAVLSFAFIPIYTKHFTSSAFGTLSLFSSLNSWLSPVVCLSLQFVIFRQEISDEIVMILKKVVGYITLLIFIVIGFVVLIGLLETETIYLVKGSLLVYFTAINLIEQNILISTKKIRRYIISILITILFSTITRLMMLDSSNQDILFNIFLISVFLQYLYLNTRRKVNNRQIKIRELLSEQRDLVIFRTIQVLISNLGNQGILIIMSIYLTLSDMGLLGLALTLLNITNTIFGKALNDFFVMNYRESLGWRRIKLDLLLSTAFSLLLFIIIFLLPDVLYKLVFNDLYKGVSSYVRIFMPLFFVILSSKPVGAALAVLSMDRELFHLEVIFSALKISCLLIGMSTGSLVMAVICMSAVSSVFYLTLISRIKMRVAY